MEGGTVLIHRLPCPLKDCGSVLIHRLKCSLKEGGTVLIRRLPCSLKDGGTVLIRRFPCSIKEGVSVFFRRHRLPWMQEIMSTLKTEWWSHTTYSFSTCIALLIRVLINTGADVNIKDRMRTSGKFSEKCFPNLRPIYRLFTCRRRRSMNASSYSTLHEGGNVLTRRLRSLEHEHSTLFMCRLAGTFIWMQPSINALTLQAVNTNAAL